jgi:hypothetical protein
LCVNPYIAWIERPCVFEADLNIEWRSLASFCPLHMGRGMGKDNARAGSLTVPARMKRGARLRHILRVQGNGADELPFGGPHLTYDVPLRRVSRLSYLGVRETPPCPIYEAVCSTSCFLLGEKASARGASLKVAGESSPAISSLVKRFRRMGIEVTATKISRVRGPKSLTPRQEQALKTAFDEGFFDYPHQTSFRQLSALIGCSPATYAFLLRKGEEKVVSEHFTNGFLT